LLSEGAPTINFDPRDIYGKYPTNFCTMAAGDDATKEEVSDSRKGPFPLKLDPAPGLPCAPVGNLLRPALRQNL
jgi:hypothetical protein